MAEKSVSIRLGARVDSYVAAMKAAKAETTSFSRATERNLKNVGTQMQTVGRRMTTFVTLPIAAAGAFAVKAAIDWESAWAGVTKTVDGTAEQMSALEQGLRDMSKELPATHQEIAAVAEAAGALGVGVEDIEDFTRVMIDLGETTDLSADQAATAIAQMMNVMGTSADDVDNLGSALVALGNDGASTESQIVDMAQRISGAGAIIGLSEASVLGFANAIASTGIEAEAGGSAFSKVISDMSKAVTLGGDKLDTFARTAGMSASQFAAAFRADPQSAIVAFIDGLGRMESTARGSSMPTLVDLGLQGIRTADLLNRLAGSGDMVTRSLETGARAWRDNTALTDEANKRYETAAARFEIVRNKAVDLFIDLGNMLLPVVEQVVEAFGDLVEMFQDLPAPLQAAIGGVVGLVAAMGPLIFVGGTVVKNLSAIKASALLLNKALSGGFGTAAKALGTIGVAAATAAVAWKILDGGHLNAVASIDASSASLHTNTSMLLSDAAAAGIAVEDINSVALAHKALSLAIAENADEKLSAALSTLNIAAEDTLDTLLALRGENFGDVLDGVTPSVQLAADYFHIGTEEARSFIAMMNNGGASVSQLDAAFGFGEEAITSFGNSLRTTTTFAIENQDAVADMARAYLDSQVQLGGTARDAVLAAESIAGLRTEGENATAVYEEFVKIVSSWTPEARAAAGVTDEMIASLQGMTPEAAAAALGMEDMADGADLVAEAVERMGRIVGGWSLTLENTKNAASRLRTAFDDILGPQDALREGIRGVWEEIDNMSEALDKGRVDLDETGKDFTFATEEGRAMQEQMEATRDAIIAHGVALVGTGQSAEVAAANIAFNTGQLEEQMRQAGYTEEEIHDLINTYGLTPERITTVLSLEGERSARETIDRYVQIIDDTVPTEVQTHISTLIERGKLDEANRLLNQLALGRTVTIAATVRITNPNVSFSASGNANAGGVLGRVYTYDMGGYIPSARMAQLHDDEVVLPLSKPGRMSTLLGMSEVGPRVMSALGAGGGGYATVKGGDTYVTVNMPPGSDGNDVVRALRKYERRNGPIPVSVR